MAVVQISRIQIRRGKENSGSGIPQLASGELGWAVDSQNLYIGNGSISEGAPYVGVTKVLTSKDLGSNGNVLDLITYQYAKNDYSITTGVLGPNNPTIRTAQAILDDLVTVRDFGAKGDGITDDTAAIQLAINQLYLNKINSTNTATRKNLKFPAGTYIVNTTIYVPSYAVLTGDGIDKTVIQFNNSAGTPGPVIQFVNDTASPGIPLIFSMPTVENATYNPTGSNGTTLKLIRTDALAGTTGITAGMVISGTGFTTSQTVLSVVDSSTLIISAQPDSTPSGVLSFTTTNAPSPSYISQPRNIEIRGMTLYTATSDQVGMQMDAVRDSTFENLYVQGAWGQNPNENSKGIYLTAFSRIVTCQRNYFKNVKVSGFTYGVTSDNDIINNSFDNLYVTDTRQGVTLGKNTNRSSVGQLYGPYNTVFSNCIFENIKQHAVYVYVGSGNATRNTRMTNVGNNGGSNITSAQYPQIYFATGNNSSQYDQSDRGDDLATTIPSVNTTYTVSGSSGTTLRVSNTTGISIGMAVSGTGFNPSVSPYVWIVQSIDSNVQVTLSAAPSSSPSGTLTFSVPYYPEVSGLVSYNSFGTRQISIGNITNAIFAFRLPVPTNGVNYVINYFYQSSQYAITRRGTMSVAVDITNQSVQFSDEYDYTGRTDSTYETNLKFTGRIVLNSLEIDYVNTTSGDLGTLVYSYSAVL
jgi:hypothetical protein